MVTLASTDRDLVVRIAVQEILTRLPRPEPDDEARIRLDLELHGILRDLDRGTMSYPWHPRIRLVIQTIADETAIEHEDQDRLWDLSLYLRTAVWPLPWHQGVSGPLDDEDRAQIVMSVRALHDALVNQDISHALAIMEEGCAYNDVYLNHPRGLCLAAMKMTLENSATLGKFNVCHWDDSKIIICLRYNFFQARLFNNLFKHTLDIKIFNNIDFISMPLIAFKTLNGWKIAR